MLVNRAQSHLLVVDVQERLAPAIADVEHTVANVARLIHYATTLDVPITFTEHMPDRIGHLLPELTAAAGTPTLHLVVAQDGTRMIEARGNLGGGGDALNLDGDSRIAGVSAA